MIARVGQCLLALGLVLLATPALALALPAPMSEQELTDKSDLIATVRVLSVSCTVVAKDDKTGEDLPVYLARLRLLEVKKGDAKKGDDKKGDDKKAAKTALASDKGRSDTVKIKRADKSSNMMWIALFALVAAGIAAWRLFLNH